MKINNLKYSKELIAKCQKYFKKKYNIDLNEEKTEEYLESIAGFYLALIND